MTWIETISGNLINSDAVKEFAVIGPYRIPDVGSEDGIQLYDLYALNVGDVEMSHFCELKGTRPFRDSHRYLLQHMSYEDCNEVFKRLKETLRLGGRYFCAHEVLERHWKICEHRQKHQTKVHANGAKA
jgi:hypothetical protein